MKFIVVQNDQEMSRAAAGHVVRTLQERADAVLGLATGSTPVGMYQELVRLYKLGGIDFSQVTTFNLDEYVGLSSNHPRSYHVYMLNHLFSHVNAVPEQIYIPDGNAPDLKKECEAYDQAIDHAGGIDLQVLGLGINGHIGFNEPGSSPEGRTMVVQLAESTIQANSRFFDNPASVPKQAITVGIGTILNCSRQIILLAKGEEKAQAVVNMMHQQPNPANPASYLKLHKDVTVIVDEQAASMMTLMTT
jgi:glucosamine-6-phosphate deaminase